MINLKKIFYARVNQILLDFLIFGFSFFAAYLIRFEGFPAGIHLNQLWVLFPYILIIRFVVFHFFSIYSIVWRYISISDSLMIFRATGFVSVLLLIARIMLPQKLSILRIPVGVITIDFLLVLLGSMGVRMLRRLIIESKMREEYTNGEKEKEKKVILIGAGAAGNMAARELKQRPDLGMKILGLVDDDPKKYKTVIQGYKVLGNTSQLLEIVNKFDIDEAIITIASTSSKEIRHIVDLCDSAKIKAKIIPGLYEILDGRIKINKIRDVKIDDLLGRSVVKLENNEGELRNKYNEKRILVTGAGGSIGSGLCRQLAALWPKELILLDKDENSIFETYQNLNNEFGSIKITPVIADLRHNNRLNIIFKRFRPQVVFHAAAHKHVPLMEENISEAVTNNVNGTKNVSEIAHEFGVETFIYISTDKAVNPTSVMGATKRIGEMIVQKIAETSKTYFSCVRFGNVLGSRGSVVPFFQKQIINGGPITITHPKIDRFFMSISEAVQLIIKAGTLGENGEIFVLDMGTPVKIVDLAKDLIRLSGFKEDEIECKYVGLRPGEKLYEELLVDKERDKTTNFQKIFMAPPIPMECENFESNLDMLIEFANSGNGVGIIKSFKKMKIGYYSERILF